MSVGQPIRRIGILVAMIGEARPIVSSLKLPPSMSSDPELKFDSWEGENGDTEIMVKTLGHDARFGGPKVGPLPTALAAYKLIEEFQPDIFINAGSAAGFSEKGVQVNEIYLGQGTAGFYDRRGGTSAFVEFCRGDYPILKASKLAAALNVKTAKITTGHSFDLEPADLKEIERTQAQIRDMEAAAIGWVAEMKSVPFLPLKVITDIIGGKIAAEPSKINYWAASETLGKKVFEAIQFLAGRSTSELD